MQIITLKPNKLNKNISKKSYKIISTSNNWNDNLIINI